MLGCLCKAHTLIAIVKDSVIRSKEDVPHDPEGSSWGGDVQAHEATDALSFTASINLHHSPCVNCLISARLAAMNAQTVLVKSQSCKTESHMGICATLLCNTIVSCGQGTSISSSVPQQRFKPLKQFRMQHCESKQTKQLYKLFYLENVLLRGEAKLLASNGE